MNSALTTGPAICVAWFEEVPRAQLRIEAGEDAVAAIGDFIGDLKLPARRRTIPVPNLSVSVVICTRDRPADLARCLAGLSSQSRLADEVIVVDNASRGEATHRVVYDAGARYIREDRPGLDIARNRGLLAASSDVVAYTDDDTELHPRWLERLVAAFDEDIASVTGLVLPACLKTEAQWYFEERWSFGRGFERVDFDQAFYQAFRSRGCPAWKVGAGANMAFRRCVFDRVGFFDERLDVGAAGCSGDSEMWYRLLAAGLKCRYEPSAVVFHHHRLDFDGLKSQIFNYMRGHVAALMIRVRADGRRGQSASRIPVAAPLLSGTGPRDSESAQTPEAAHYSGDGRRSLRVYLLPTHPSARPGSLDQETPRPWGEVD